MFCSECGTKIPDEAQFCPFCGNAIKKKEKSFKESPIKDSNLESDFKLYLEEEAETVFLYQFKPKKFYLIAEKLSSSVIYGANIQLSGPPHINILIKSRKVDPTKKKSRLFFTIAASEPGSFTLTATLTSNVGYRITLPIEVQVEPTKVTHNEEKIAELSQPASVSSKATNDNLIAARIIFGIIGLLLLFAGVMVFTSGGFGSGLPLGITLAIIGVVILGIVSKGICCYAGAGCDGDCCDCVDCCDC